MKKLNLKKLKPKAYVFLLALMLCTFGASTAIASTNTETDISLNEAIQTYGYRYYHRSRRDSFSWSQCCR